MTLPADWEILPLEDVARCQGGVAFSPALQGRKEGELPFYKVSDMNAPDNQWLMVRANNYVSAADRQDIGADPKPARSVVFPKVGAAIHTNKKRLLASSAYVDNNVMAVWTREERRCLPEFLYAYFLRLPLSDLAAPGPLPSITNTRVLSQTIALPSLEEQARITALLSQARAAIDVEDRLLATAMDLKQAMMARLFSRGLRSADTTETPFGLLPSTWRTLPLGECCRVQSGVTKGRTVDPSEAVDVPYLRVANVQDGHLDLREVKMITLRRSEVAQFLLQDGDVLLTEGGDFDKLGRGFVWRGEVSGCVHQNHVFAVRPKRDVLLPEFLAYLVQSPYGKSYFLTVAHKTTNLASINSTKLKALPVPLPQLDEQREIVDIMTAIDRKLDTHERRCALFSEMFGSLLDDLMTGRRRVADLPYVATVAVA